MQQAGGVAPRPQTEEIQMHPQPSRRGQVRFYVEGRAVDARAFWEAVRRLGGQATVEALDPEPAYRLTPKGRAAAQGRGG
jgi:hypothetical protein